MMQPRSEATQTQVRIRETEKRGEAGGTRSELREETNERKHGASKANLVRSAISESPAAKPEARTARGVQRAGRERNGEGR
jgi:hypothetical protein